MNIEYASLVQWIILFAGLFVGAYVGIAMAMVYGGQLALAGLTLALVVDLIALLAIALYLIEP